MFSFAIITHFCYKRMSIDPPSSLPADYFALLNQTSPDLAHDMTKVRQDDCKDLGKASLDLVFFSHSFFYLICLTEIQSDAT